MKWLIVFASFIFGKMNSQVNPSLVFLEQVMVKSRSMIFMINIALVSSALLVAGVIIGLTNALAQYDANGVIAFTATFVGGVVLAVLSAISLGVVFAKRNWNVPHLAEAAHQPRTPSPIEEAITMLLTDFVSERRNHREHPAPPPPHEREHGPDHDRDQAHVH